MAAATDEDLHAQASFLVEKMLERLEQQHREPEEGLLILLLSVRLVENALEYMASSAPTAAFKEQAIRDIAAARERLPRLYEISQREHARTMVELAKMDGSGVVTS